jgi:IS5 family transposase
VVDADGIPLGAVLASANTHDSPLLAPTLDALAEVGPLPERPTVHLDRGYDSGRTRRELARRGLSGRIAERDAPAPIQASRRWPVERTHAWTNSFGKLRWCTERRRSVVGFWVTLAHAIIIVRRLIRRAWACYRWQGRPHRRP